MVNAARIARTFYIDPLMVLGSTDLEWVIRLACAKVVERDIAAEQNAHS